MEIMPFNNRSLQLMTYLIISCTVVCSTQVLHGQNREIIKGNEAYKAGNLEEAEKSFKKAIEKKSNSKALYNLGNTYYKKGEYDQAQTYYDRALDHMNSKEELAKTYHNKGNTAFQKQDLEASAEAYQKALQANPNDPATIENLYKVQRLRQQQQSQQQSQQQQSQEQEKQEQEKQEPQNQNQQEQDQDELNQQNQSPQSDQDQNHQDDNNMQQEQKSNSRLTKEMVEDFLKSIENQDKKLQEKIRRNPATKQKPKKDW